jgi:uncharacterized protein YjbI with pentapeptide repeats
MSSIEAIASIRSGPLAWHRYHEHDRRPDLSFGILDNADLRGMRLSSCSLVSAQLENANLDGATFESCDLTGATLTNASVVRARFINCCLTNVDMSECIIRDTIFKDCSFLHTEFRQCQMTGVTVDESSFEEVTTVGWLWKDVSMKSCTFRKIVAEQACIQSSRVQGSAFEEVDFTGSTLQSFVISHSTVARVICRDTSLRDCALTDCKCNALEFIPSSVVGLDLSNSVVFALKVEQIGLQTANLLNTALVDCCWPPQGGRITSLGTYIPSPFLVRQPAQDIRGLEPLLRREIADAQFLVALHARARNTATRMLLRFWGLTSCFGQSLWRLASVSFLCITILALLATVHAHLAIALALPSGSQLAHNIVEELDTFANAFCELGTNFLGLELSSTYLKHQGLNTYPLVARVSGFFALGVWISVAANRLGKLSAD